MDIVSKEFNLNEIEPGVMIFSKETYKVCVVNNTFLLQFSEFSKEEIFERNILSFHKEDAIKKIKHLIELVNNTKTSSPFLLKKVDLHGNDKYLLIKLIKLFDGVDMEQFYCLLTFDVSEHILDNNRFISYLPIEQKNEIKLISADKILYIKAENVYSSVFTKNNNFLSYFTIGYLEKKLNKNRFFRVHRSYIINIKYIEKIIKKDNSYSIQMKFYNETIPLSRSKVKEFKSFIGLK
jgi:DNA-binding LytR/AlgR family response regulator